MGQIGERMFAFIGLERDSGIMVHDVTSPADAFFVDYIPPYFPRVDGDGSAGVLPRISPESIIFIPAEESTSGKAQIAVAYEVSGTTAVFDLDLAGVDPVDPGPDPIFTPVIDDPDVVGGDGGGKLTMGSDDDSAIGGAGDDRIKARSDEGVAIDGGTGDDRIKGRNGDDIIIGGEGDDLLTGGNGADEFRFAIGFGKDVISDFDFGEDFLVFDAGLFAPGTTVDDVAENFATVTGRDVVFDFGDAGMLTLRRAGAPGEIDPNDVFAIV